MRRKRATKRELSPDYKYGDPLVTRFVNGLMRDGKKSLAFSIFYDTIELVSDKTKEDGLEIWRKALNNVMPALGVKRRRVGGATLQVPVEIRPDRRVFLGMKWLISSARDRGEKTMKERLTNEIIAASNEEGSAFKRKVDTHKMASSNKAFSHFNLK
ncbi:30S ribosomal protein S7 [Cardinium endosymbiont of Culicoides punctatus]|uniref:30S ribosomal protein S7 n=1 Tax=Cardinium endosymbiont of Culicoides punctatus TaxID=2304601 RepID=UPI001058958F|nr:30S ribosomal protein S7 [Cardinium endosymbiont of Culicoides punctatus]TDG94732.1 30S ribosomal protein S7 [Cardinium endosymbiont of Culicoides punctatus]